MQDTPVMQVDRSMVIAKAVARAMNGLGLPDRALQLIGGFGEPLASHILRGERGIEPASEAGRRSLMLIQLFRALDALVEGDGVKRRAWMTSHNAALDGIPASLITSEEGLVRTLAHLERMRVSV